MGQNFCIVFEDGRRVKACIPTPSAVTTIHQREKTYKAKPCLNQCGDWFLLTRRGERFCSEKCRIEFNSRKRARKTSRIQAHRAS